MKKSTILIPFNLKKQLHLSLLLLLILTVMGISAWTVEQQMYPSKSEKDINNQLALLPDETVENYQNQASPLLQNTIPWNVPFWAVPSADGADIFITTTPLQNALATGVEADVSVGGAPAECFYMTYNITDTKSYEVTAYGILPANASLAEGTITLETNLGNNQIQSTGPVAFRQFSVPTNSETAVLSTDNNLEMNFSPNTLGADAHVLVMSSHTIPGTLPFGHALVGSPYSTRASGQIVDSPNPILLKLAYSNITLGEIDPHTLSIFRWIQSSQAWVDEGRNLDNLFEKAVSTTVHNFAIYALLSTPHWQDSFNDFSGLSERNNVTIFVAESSLILNNDTTGTAISSLITPTISTYTWDNAYFNSTVPDGTSLSIDVLDANNTVLLSDITNTIDLSTLNPNTHPSLKLRANFSATTVMTSPHLLDWGITWKPIAYQIYLPMIMK